MIRYYICLLGYDVNGNITDYEKYYGAFNTYAEAYELFVKLQCTPYETLFENANGVNQLLIQVEECEEYDEYTECIDVKNEWWIVNPNFKEA